MGATNRGDLLVREGQVYDFIQRKGAKPGSALELFSLHGVMGGFEEPEAEPEAIYHKSVAQRGKWDKIGETVGQPDAKTTSFTEYVPRETAALIERMKKRGDKFAMHQIMHQDADPQNYSQWESREVFEGVRLTSYSRDRGESTEDKLLQIEAEAQYDSRARLFHMYFGEEASTEITKEVIGVAVYPDTDFDDADEKEIYLLTKVDTTAPKLVYSKNGGATWTAVSLTTIGTDEPSAIAVVSNYVIICSSAGLAYYYASRDDLTTWTKVTTGFVASKGPTCIYAKAVGEIYFAAAGGYLYKLTVPGQAVTVLDAGSLTVQNFNDIHGSGDTILAVGASNAVVISRTNGRSWSLLTGPAVGVTLNCCFVWDKNNFWIGADGLYFTEDGDTFVAVTLPVTVATVEDIVFSAETNMVGFVVGKTAAPLGVIMRTEDGGNEWEVYSIHDVPSNEGLNVLAVGGPNYLVAGGVKTVSGADGVAAVGLN